MNSKDGFNAWLKMCRHPATVDRDRLTVNGSTRFR